MRNQNSIIICYTKRRKLGVNFSGSKPGNEWTLTGRLDFLYITDTKATAKSPNQWDEQTWLNEHGLELLLTRV
jgi:hypothetical protein